MGPVEQVDDLLIGCVGIGEVPHLQDCVGVKCGHFLHEYTGTGQAIVHHVVVQIGNQSETHRFFQTCDGGGSDFWQRQCSGGGGCRPQQATAAEGAASLRRRAVGRVCV